MSTDPDPMSNLNNPDARARLKAHFEKATGSTEHGAKWDDLYKSSFVPWDKGFPSPALVDLLSERSDILPKPQSGKKLKALVPGCGKGYDVLLLAAHGYDAYGLEISPLALEAARKNEKERGSDEVYQGKGDGEKGSVNWISGDFFKGKFLKDVEGEGKFDLIYDYTFLSALPPVMRPAWSKRFNELLAPNGRLVCVEFPTYKPASTGGPPWALPPKVYTAHLPRPGQEVSYAEDGELLEAELGEPSKEGLVRVEHFKPKRTHDIGMNEAGEVTDFVGVWAHPKS